MSQLVIKNKCSRCNGVLVTTEENICCKKCGVVVEDRIVDMSIDYDKGENGQGARVGPENPKGRLIDIEISNTGKDGKHNKLSGSRKHEFKRLKKIDTRGKIDKTEIIGIYEIQRICDELSLNSIVKEDAENIFQTCKKRNLLRGRTGKEFAASCVVAASRRAGNAKPLSDFAKISYTRKTKLMKYYKVISLEIDLQPKIMFAEQYLGKILSNISPPLSIKNEKHTRELLQKYPHKDGKDPKSLAAGALYLSAKRNGSEITQRIIALAADVSPVTIRNRASDIEKWEKEQSGESEDVI
tara:strand:- start:1433 stop:2326 length:894 start_codon:yes stop_codon:yes gene_type:complete